MFLSKKQIENYEKLGVIIIKDIFKKWIEPLKVGFQKVLENPSEHGRENVTDSKGRFFEDYCNWQRIEEFKDCIFNSSAAQIIAEATSSKSSQIFHDHIFIKEPGTIKETPWHQDMPYYCVDGNDTGSFWIPLDEVKIVYNYNNSLPGYYHFVKYQCRRGSNCIKSMNGEYVSGLSVPLRSKTACYEFINLISNLK